MMYKLLKYTINNGDYDRGDMLTKLGVFFDAGDLTQEQYDELIKELGE